MAEWLADVFLSLGDVSRDFGETDFSRGVLGEGGHGSGVKPWSGPGSKAPRMYSDITYF